MHITNFGAINAICILESFCSLCAKLAELCQMATGSQFYTLFTDLSHLQLPYYQQIISLPLGRVKVVIRIVSFRNSFEEEKYLKLISRKLDIIYKKRYFHPRAFNSFLRYILHKIHVLLVCLKLIMHTF